MLYVFYDAFCKSSAAIICRHEGMHFASALIYCKNTSALSVKSCMRLVSSRWDACVLQKPSRFACKVDADVGSWPPGLIKPMLDLAVKNQGFCSVRASRRHETSPMSTLYNKTHVSSDALLKHAPNPFMRNTWHRPTVHGGPNLLRLAQIVVKKQPRFKHRVFSVQEVKYFTESVVQA